MKQADHLLLSFASKRPKTFDAPTDIGMFKEYAVNYLGLKWNDLAELRYKQVPYETLRRRKQILVSKGEIQLSEENKKVRRVKEQRVREVVKQKVEEKPKVISYRFEGNTAYAIR